MTDTIQLPEALDAELAKLEADPKFAAMVPVLRSQFGDHVKLVQANDRKIARVNESKDTDPNSTEYQDATWKRVADEKSDPEIVKLEAQYQKLMAAIEKAEMQLRELSKKHMQPALSEEQVQALRKEINEGKKPLDESTKALSGVVQMANQMFELAGIVLEKPLVDLLPKPDSLMNTRGRKPGAVKREGGYATRLSEAFIDNAPIFKVKKDKNDNEVRHAHFNHIAETLSREFDDKNFPQNQVTSEEVERAYYNSKGVAFRESSEMPLDHTFEFTKEISVRNGADNSVKQEPITKVIRVVKWTKTETENTENSENA